MALNKETDLQPVAEIILVLIKVLKSNPDTEMSAWCKSLLVQACRKMEEFVVPEVSIRAQLTASEQGLGDLRQFRWKDQPVKMKDPRRKIYHWEHVLPVSQMTRLLLENASADYTIERIISLLRSADIAWILKEENAVLTRLNFGTCRPVNPWHAYKAANIAMADR